MIVDLAAGRQWTDSGIDGLRMSVAWATDDGDGGYFADFRAGTRFPPHGHDGWEQVLVLSGRIRFGAAELTAGDRLKVQAGDEHDALALDDTRVFVAHRGGIQIKD